MRTYQLKVRTTQGVLFAFVEADTPEEAEGFLLNALPNWGFGIMDGTGVMRRLVHEGEPVWVFSRGSIVRPLGHETDGWGGS